MVVLQNLSSSRAGVPPSPLIWCLCLILWIIIVIVNRYWSVDWSYHKMNILSPWKLQVDTCWDKIWWFMRRVYSRDPCLEDIETFLELAMNLLLRQIAKVWSIFLLRRSKSGIWGGIIFCLCFIFRLRTSKERDNIVADALSRRPQISYRSVGYHFWVLRYDDQYAIDVDFLLYETSCWLKSDDRIAYFILCGTSRKDE